MQHALICVFYICELYYIFLTTKALYANYGKFGKHRKAKRKARNRNEGRTRKWKEEVKERGWEA